MGRWILVETHDGNKSPSYTEAVIQSILDRLRLPCLVDTSKIFHTSSGFVPTTGPIVLTFSHTNQRLVKI